MFSSYVRTLIDLVEYLSISGKVSYEEAENYGGCVVATDDRRKEMVENLNLL